MPTAAPIIPATFVHKHLDSGIEFAADLLPERKTVAMCFRMLTGVVHEPVELTGVGSIVERTLSKGTENYDGRALADAFDQLGVQWGSASGRQTMLVRLLCLPEFVEDAVKLVAEMMCRPTFPDDACRVAVELAQQDLKHMEDEPYELLRLLIQRLTYGDEVGRYPGGTPETLARLTPDVIRDHWRKSYSTGRMQVVAAGPVDADKLARQINACFAGLGSAGQDRREPLDYTFTPRREHRGKELEQEYMGITLPGVPRDSDEFPIEQVLIGVLAGGMSGRLFTEVREKQGLVYWVGAWHEEPRGSGIIHLGASTRPDRCEQTYKTLLRELERLGEDLTPAESDRARDGLIAHCETENDLTRARAASLSDDLFHHGRPIGLTPKLKSLQAVTVDHVADFARRLPLDQLCVGTVGPKSL